MPFTPDDQSVAKPVTLKDVALACGVSVTAVSQTLHGRPARLAEDTKERIRQMALTLGYDPAKSQGARRLVMSRFGHYVLNHLVALALPGDFYRAPYYTTVVKSILEVLNDEGFGVLILDSSRQSARRFPPILQRGDVDGMITLLGVEESRYLLAQLAATPGFAHRPIISLMTALPAASSVVADTAAGAQAEVEHLIALGHHTFLYFRRPNGTPFGTHQDQLYEGYRHACLAHRLDPDRHLIPVDIDAHVLRLGFSAASNQQVTLLNSLKPGLPALPPTSWARYRRVLRHHPQITALLAPNDATAIVLRYMLVAEGKRVPDDYSLVGFDDTDPLLDDHGRNNLLTTVNLSLPVLGRKAARVLLDRLTGRTAHDTHHVVPTQLVVRASTAPPR